VGKTKFITGQSPRGEELDYERENFQSQVGFPAAEEKGRWHSERKRGWRGGGRKVRSEL